VYVGLIIAVVSYPLFGLASQGWMMFAITAVSAFGGISGPALQGISSNAVPANVQGELRGAQTSLMSLCSIIGPLFMTNLFAYFTSKGAPFQWPGAPYWVAGVLCACSLWLLLRLLRKPAPAVASGV